MQMEFTNSIMHRQQLVPVTISTSWSRCLSCIQACSCGKAGTIASNVHVSLRHHNDHLLHTACAAAQSHLEATAP